MCNHVRDHEIVCVHEPKGDVCHSIDPVLSCCDQRDGLVDVLPKNKRVVRNGKSIARELVRQLTRKAFGLSLQTCGSEKEPFRTRLLAFKRGAGNQGVRMRNDQCVQPSIKLWRCWFRLLCKAIPELNDGLPAIVDGVPVIGVHRFEVHRRKCDVKPSNSNIHNAPKKRREFSLTVKGRV